MFTIKTIYISRLVNLILYAYSYLFSKIFQKVKVYNLPLALHIETSSICNLGCLFCDRGQGSISRPKDLMTLKDFQQITTKIPKSIYWITLYFQGEPLLDKTIIEKIKYLRVNNYFVEISTNAQNITKEMATALVESGLNRIIISMDGISQKTYEKYRINGNITKVFEAINNLLDAKKNYNKKNPKIIIQYIVFKHNEDEIDIFKKMMKKLDVNIRIKNAQLKDDAIDYLPNNKKYRRYKINNDKLQLNKSLPKPCYRLWKEIIFLQNGQIAICCHDKNGKLLNETWHNKTIKQIWNSQELNAIRQKTLIGDNLEICKNCDI
ncbi:MAG: hypothetical protein PWQ43_1480 [Rikenellaceae bacterium]|nr:hypothetical protein [Rikenellaceae bacterium]